MKKAINLLLTLTIALMLLVTLSGCDIAGEILSAVMSQLEETAAPTLEPAAPTPTSPPTSPPTPDPTPTPTPDLTPTPSPTSASITLNMEIISVLGQPNSALRAINGDTTSGCMSEATTDYGVTTSYASYGSYFDGMIDPPYMFKFELEGDPDAVAQILADNDYDPSFDFPFGTFSNIWPDDFIVRGFSIRGDSDVSLVFSSDHPITLEAMQESFDGYEPFFVADDPEVGYYTYDPEVEYHTFDTWNCEFVLTQLPDGSLCNAFATFREVDGEWVMYYAWVYRHDLW